ncbi:hypothetical protein ANN_07871 [Periplaneta americana]|uniref:Uncharacterized protein n=1 Tax=Periplaneta americana TaxID=6978 RepID=A0ABQ8T177_PERAM|nr:hypothetical protein ANN_07871 [Periplaneta americana]
MADLCEGGNEPPGSLKASNNSSDVCVENFKETHMEVRDWLNDVVPDRWIGRKGPNDRACFAWPPRSPDLTGIIKDRLYVPPLPADLPDLRQRIEAVVATITPDTLIKPEDGKCLFLVVDEDDDYEDDDDDDDDDDDTKWEEKDEEKHDLNWEKKKIKRMK